MWYTLGYELQESHRKKLKCICWRNPRKLPIVDNVMVIIDRQFDDFLKIVDDEKKVTAILMKILEDNNKCVGRISWRDNLEMLLKIRRRDKLKTKDEIKTLLLMKYDFEAKELLYTENEIIDELLGRDVPSKEGRIIETLQTLLETDVDPNASDEDKISFSRNLTYDNMYLAIDFINYKNK